MKKILLSLLILTTGFSSTTFAQHKYSAQLYAGMNNYYGDINKKATNLSLGLNAGYFIKPWASINIDIQHGKLSGGDRLNPNLLYMEFENKYTAIALMPRIYFLNITPIFQKPNVQKYVSGLYLSGGVGIFMNNPKSHNPHIPDVGYLGYKKSNDLIIPMELGYQLPLYVFSATANNAPTGKSSTAHTLYLTAAYRYNLGFSDAWDGYIPTVNANQNNDGMDLLSIGLQYQF